MKKNLGYGLLILLLTASLRPLFHLDLYHMILVIIAEMGISLILICASIERSVNW